MPSTLVTSSLLDEFAATLRPRLAGTLHLDAMTRGLYSTDASMYQMMPVGVLIPKHSDDIQAAVELAHLHRIPVLPRGGGSSLAGQCVAEALVIDCSRYLDRMLEVNQEERWVRVQPGLILQRLNKVLAPYGLMFGPDPASASRATLGGMVGNNATGTHSILYGNVVRHVHAIKAVLDDGSPVTFGSLSADAWAERQRRNGREGEIYHQLGALLAANRTVIERDTPKHWRKASGYRLETLLDEQARNVASLLCGSEGTLAVSTELKLGVVPKPKMTAIGIVHYRTRREALLSVTTILKTEPSAIELFDGTTIQQVRQSPGFAPRLTWVDGEPGSVLLTEYYGDSEKELKQKIDALETLMEQTGEGYAVVRVFEPAQIADVWGVRSEALGLIMNVRGDYKPVAFIEDASVPVEHLAEYVEGLQKLLDETNTEAVFYAHASGGCLHVRPFINTKDAAEVRKMRDINHGAMELVRKLGGVVSSEHGDGLARSWLLPELIGKDLYDAHRYLKGVFDPNALLNPGKIVDAPEMTEHLRMGPTYNTIPVLTEQDFTEDLSFASLVEMCNGNGACRKLESGTMCPSFMVTREEKDSTRGRANALRLAMSGALPKEELTGEAMYEVMDLCIQCKACKTECPSNVDMAKLKTEWLNMYWQANKMPLRTKLFAHIPRLSRLASGPLAGPVNWVNRQKPVRALLDKALGISAKRELPPFASQPFTQWFRKQQWEALGQPVVLFADTFSNYNHPEVARAAATFLHKAGYRVIVPEQTVCCGRTYISKGIVTEAQRQALLTVDILHEYAEEGYPIVGLEPSCILTLADEFRTLLPGDLHVSKVADAAVMFEDFVAAEAERGALDHLTWTDDTREVLLHGHCHQKALIGTTSAERCLSLPPGYSVRTVDSGCCGMAGAFGYEREHVEVSKAMAERVLAPAVRATSADTLIAAAGTSCRAQIEDLTDRQPLHPAQILLDALIE